MHSTLPCRLNQLRGRRVALTSAGYLIDDNHFRNPQAAWSRDPSFEPQPDEADEEAVAET